MVLISLVSTSRPWLRISSVKLSSAPTRRVGSRSATKVPRPWRRTTTPSPASAPMAWRTVIRATPYRAASSVSDGSRSPAAHSPTAILILKSSRMLTWTGLLMAFPVIEDATSSRAGPLGAAPPVPAASP